MNASEERALMARRSHVITVDTVTHHRFGTSFWRESVCGQYGSEVQKATRSDDDTLCTKCRRALAAALNGGR